MKMQIAIKSTRKEPSDANAPLGQRVKLQSLLLFKWSHPFGIFSQSFSSLNLTLKKRKKSYSKMNITTQIFLETLILDLDEL